MGKKTLMQTIKDMFAGSSDSVTETNGPVRPERRANTWAMAGRLTQMQIRTLMQLKAFGRM